MRLGPPPSEPEVPGQFWIDFIRDTAPVFRKSTLEQIGEFIQPTWQALIDGAIYVHPRLEQIIGELEPDVIVEDNVVSFPAVMASGRPWARIVSCNPAELRDPIVAPFSSGYAAADPSRWAIFQAEYNRVHADSWKAFDAFCRDRGAGGLGNSPLGPEFMHESPFLNLYAYPAEADYRRMNPLAPTWHRLDSTIRATDGAWSVPRASRVRARRPRLPLARQPRVRRRRPDAAAGRRAGPDGAPGDRVEGAAGRPDQVARQHGRRVIPAPAGDPAAGRSRDHARRQQHRGGVVPQRQADDRAAVVLGPGRQCAARARDGLRSSCCRPTGSRTRSSLGAIDTLLADTPLRERMAGIAARMQAERGTERAADLIERLATTHAPVLREA